MEFHTFDAEISQDMLKFDSDIANILYCHYIYVFSFPFGFIPYLMCLDDVDGESVGHSGNQCLEN